MWSLFKNESCCIVYKLDITNILKIFASIRINSDFSVEVHVNGGRLPNEALRCTTSNLVICRNSLLTEWSQLSSLIDFCDYYVSPDNNKSIIVSQITTSLQSLKLLLLQNDENCDESSLKKLDILCNQFDPVFMKKPKYVVSTIINSFLIYIQSVKCYDVIRLNNIRSLISKKTVLLISNIPFFRN